jgi:hypothetical protein
LETEIKKLEIDNTAEPEVPQELQKERTPPVEKVTKEIISLQGKKGTPYGAITNSIILQCDKEYGVYEYDVRFKPALDAVRSRHASLSKEIIVCC